MANKYKVGDMVMVLTYRPRGRYAYTSSESWDGPREIVGFVRKYGGSWRTEYQPDENGSYAIVKTAVQERRCGHCEGSGSASDGEKKLTMVDGVLHYRPAPCDNCDGTGKIMLGGNTSYEHKSKLKLVSEFAETADRIAAEVQRRKDGESRRNNHVANDLRDLVAGILATIDQPVSLTVVERLAALKFAAEFIGKYSDTLVTSASEYRHLLWEQKQKETVNG